MIKQLKLRDDLILTIELMKRSQIRPDTWIRIAIIHENVEIFVVHFLLALEERSEDATRKEKKGDTSTNYKTTT